MNAPINTHCGAGDESEAFEDEEERYGQCIYTFADGEQEIETIGDDQSSQSIDKTGVFSGRV